MQNITKLVSRTTLNIVAKYHTIGSPHSRVKFNKVIKRYQIATETQTKHNCEVSHNCNQESKLSIIAKYHTIGTKNQTYQRNENITKFKF